MQCWFSGEGAEAGVRAGVREGKYTCLCAAQVVLLLVLVPFCSGIAVRALLPVQTVFI